MKNNKPRCRNCSYCKQIGRMDGRFSTNGMGRKTYYCEHPNVRDILNKYGQPIHPFVGFGDTTYQSPLTLKTCKQWCPMKAKEEI